MFPFDADFGIVTDLVRAGLSMVLLWISNMDWGGVEDRSGMDFENWMSGKCDILRL